MPTFKYLCVNGHEHERMRIEPDDFRSRACPECGHESERQLGTPHVQVKGGTPKFHHEPGKGK